MVDCEDHGIPSSGTNPLYRDIGLVDLGTGRPFRSPFSRLPIEVILCLSTISCLARAELLELDNFTYFRSMRSLR